MRPHKVGKSIWLGHRGAVDHKLNGQLLSDGLVGWHDRHKKNVKRELQLKTLMEVQSMPNLGLLPTRTYTRPKRREKPFDFGMSCFSNPQSKLGEKKSTGELGRTNPREGAVRDLHVLGTLSEKMILAFKGRGTLQVHLEHESQGQLEGQDTEWEEAYEKHLTSSRMYRFMEFDVPHHLPATLVVIGDSVYLYKPMKESRLKAKISSCGQVISSVSHLGS